MATVYRNKAFLWLLSFCFYEKKVTRCCEQLSEVSLQPHKASKQPNANLNNQFEKVPISRGVSFISIKADKKDTPLLIGTFKLRPN